MIVVNEIFGVTFQGEGKSIGMPCFFLRLTGCNLSCVFCDTPYTWDWTGKNGKVYDPKQESHPMSAETVFEMLEAMSNTQGNVTNLVISGGEPMLQQKALIPLVDALIKKGWWVEIETAGTIAPLPEFNVSQYTVSPKLQNSGNLLDKRHIAPVLDDFVQSDKAVYKFVVSDLTDFAEIDWLVEKHLMCGKCVYIMPEGVTPEKIQRHSQLVATETIKRGWNLTTRLQIMLYGNQRGI